MSETDIAVRPMTPGELSQFLDETAREYAAHKVASGAWPAEGAPERALRQAHERLPEGVATPHAILLTALAIDKPVGGAWLGRHSAESPTTAWLYEIQIYEDERGAGFGRALLTAVEDAARAAGYTSIALNVFGANLVARSLYESGGYVVRAMQLAKALGASEV